MHFILEEALTKRWPFIAEDSLFVSTSLVLDSDHTSSKKKVELWWQGRNSTITSKSIGRFCKFCSYELPWCKNLFQLAKIVVVHLTSVLPLLLKEDNRVQSLRKPLQSKEKNIAKYLLLSHHFTDFEQVFTNWVINVVISDVYFK